MMKRILKVIGNMKENYKMNTHLVLLDKDQCQQDSIEDFNLFKKLIYQDNRLYILKYIEEVCRIFNNKGQ